MKDKKKIYYVILGLTLLWLSGGSLHAEPMRTTENLRGEIVMLPSSAPEPGQFILVSFVMVAPEAEVIASVATYDDPQTRRSIDYLELYDEAGSLLLVSWVDSFGIISSAIVRGLLQEEASRLEGVLVLLQEGTPA
ncbi:MAG: hypothetical protein O7C72_07995 [Deltaproteobacteria bacterium]|nr:hypothetical protein [Deltaproteobacteria bacterium]